MRLPIQAFVVAIFYTLGFAGYVPQVDDLNEKATKLRDNEAIDEISYLTIRTSMSVIISQNFALNAVYTKSAKNMAGLDRSFELSILLGAIAIALRTPNVSAEILTQHFLGAQVVSEIGSYVSPKVAGIALRKAANEAICFNQVILDKTEFESDDLKDKMAIIKMMNYSKNHLMERLTNENDIRFMEVLTAW